MLVMEDSVKGMAVDPEFSVAILCGGSSERMGAGRNKALAELAGRPMLAHTIDALAPLCSDLFITGGDAAVFGGFGVPHCADHYQQRAAIVGIFSALAASRTDWCLVVSCDMPFASAALARQMSAAATGCDAVVPESGHGPEPLFSLYNRSCLTPLREGIERGDLSIRSALKQVRVKTFSEAQVRRACDPEAAFLNVNTPADLELARQRLASSRPSGYVHPTPLFDSGSPTPLVLFVGKKNSGKTTFLEKLVRMLTSAGASVAYIKHDVHGFQMDREGTDTQRLAQAGARRVLISSPAELALLEKVEQEAALDRLRQLAGREVDIVIGEGFKSAKADKIELSRRDRSMTLACPEEELMAVISDRPDAARNVPVFGLDDVAGVAAFLQRHYALGLRFDDSQTVEERVRGVAR